MIARVGSPLIAPSILAADFTRLGEQLASCNDHGVKWIHCDIMDGHFVPNISYGPMIVEAARRAWPHLMDAHLMTYHPDAYLKALVDAGANLVTVHQEATPHLHRSLAAIHDAGLKAGVALNPSTPVQTLELLLNQIDLVTVMSVNPGFGGQSFIPESLTKIRQLKTLREDHGLSFLIQVDGGVGKGNVAELVRAGADILVAGNSVFSAAEPGAEAQRLQEMADMALINPV